LLGLYVLKVIIAQPNVILPDRYIALNLILCVSRSFLLF